MVNDDPVLVRRARFVMLATWGKRVGYGLLAVAIVAFAVGAAVGYTRLVTTTVTACLLATVVTLAPAMVIGYGVQKAEREERGVSR